MKKIAGAVVAAAGLALFAWYLHRLGLRQVWETISRIGPWAPLLLLPYLLVYFVDCHAWRLTLPRLRAPFGTLFKVRWAGESVNNLLPTGYVGGEAAKVYLLQKLGADPSEAAIGAVVSKTLQTCAQLLFILLAGFGLFLLTPNRADHWPMLVVLVVATGAGFLALWGMQRIGLFRMAMAGARLLPFAIHALQKRKEKLLALDRSILGFYREHPRRVYASAALYFAGWLLDTVEVFLVALLLGTPISWLQALVVEAFTGMAKVAGTWIPGSLGVQESGIVLSAKAAGLPDTLGASYAVIRRSRELLFAAVGVWLFCQMRRSESAPATSPEFITKR